jgi:peptidyl-prolyl cis-trans isomerase SurA
MRLMRALRANASREAALESLIEDRIKLAEVRKYGIQPSVQDALNEMGRIAVERKIPPAQLSQSIQAAGVAPTHWQEHGRAQAGWRGYVAALNKGVGVSEVEVRAELKRRGSSGAAEYRLRPIVLIVPRNADPGVVAARGREAESLRSRFTNCDSGLKLVQGMRDTAIRPAMTRSAATLSPQFVAIVEKTPVGRLTPPQRSADGIEMLAVCDKSTGGTDGPAAQAVREELLARRLSAVGEKLYEPLRKRAIIVRR